jgi:uncharacterized protein (TIGR03083 family)
MDFLSSIRRDSERFYAAAEGADPVEVPSCPGWTIADLVWHLGEVHWFWGTDIETRATDPDGIEAAKPFRPTDYGELVEWGRSQASRLIGLLEAAPDDTPVWTWALNESDHTVGFIRRHQVQEAAVHRWDMQNAAAPPPEPIDPEVASDSIDEMLAITLPWDVRPDKPLPGSVHIHCTDTPGEWFLHTDGRVERAHARGDVAIRGAASDILLWLYRRVPLDRLNVVGHATLAPELLDRIDTS